MPSFAGAIRSARRPPRRRSIAMTACSARSACVTIRWQPPTRRRPPPAGWASPRCGCWCTCRWRRWAWSSTGCHIAPSARSPPAPLPNRTCRPRSRFLAASSCFRWPGRSRPPSPPGARRPCRRPAPAPLSWSSSPHPPPAGSRSPSPNAVGASGARRGRTCCCARGVPSPRSCAPAGPPRPARSPGWWSSTGSSPVSPAPPCSRATGKIWVHLPGSAGGPEALPLSRSNRAVCTSAPSRGSPPRPPQHRRRRSRAVMAAAALVAALCCAVHCGRPPAAAERPLRIALDSGPFALDPHAGELLTLSVLRNLYDALTAFDAGNRVRPALAESWENPDELTWIFHLRRGVFFHDGREFTARDVLFSFDRARRAAPASEIGTYLVAIDKVLALDAHTVEITTRRPYSILLNKLAFVLIVPEGSPPVISRPVGTGPYRLVSDQPGKRLALRVFERYWGGAAGVRRVEFLPLPDPEARVRGLLDGDLDVVAEPGIADVERIRAARGCRIAEQTSLGVT